MITLIVDGTASPQRASDGSMWVPADQKWIERVQEHAAILSTMQETLDASRLEARTWKGGLVIVTAIQCAWFLTVLVRML